MHLRSRQTSFCVSLLGAVALLMSSETFAHAQHLFNLDWGEAFNNSANGEVEDNWVANSFTISGTDRTHIVAIILPIFATFNNQPISALIYQGVDMNDPTQGLTLLQRTDTTITTTSGQIVTLTLDTPVDFNVGDIMYAAVLIPGIDPPDANNLSGVFPFYLDVGTGSGLGGLLQTQPLQQSFFDVGATMGGAWDPSQGVANITVMGGTHPVVGVAQDPGNLALWVYGTAAP
jgi:hypothetical protein